MYRNYCIILKVPSNAEGLIHYFEESSFIPLKEKKNVVRAIIVFFITTILIGLTIGLNRVMTPAPAATLCAAAGLLTLEFFRLSKVEDIKSSVYIISTIIIGGGFWFCLQKNGIAPGAMIIMFVPTCMGVSLLSIKEGAIILLITGVCMGALILAPHLPWEFQSPAPDEIKFAARVGVPLFTALLIIFLFYVAFINRSLMVKLRTLNLELEQKTEHKQQFLAKMSHEVRTPLNGIYGITQLLQITEDEQERKDYLQTLSFSTQSLLHIVNEILDYSKIEKGKIELEIRDINLKNVIDEITHLFKPKCQELGLYIKSEFAPSLPEKIQSDSFRLTQIFANLINNAIKFTKEGGITLYAKCLNDRLVFSVIDTGIGIPKEKQGSIFQEFNQADSSTSRNFGGTGLGLNITKDLIELFGGEITILSEEGKGSEFQFWIPLQISHSKADTEEMTPLPQTESLPTELSILLAEDNPINQKVICKFLEKMGLDDYKVVSDGKKAVDSVQVNHYDLILMDVNMPEMDGLEATRAIRKFNIPQPVIIALTANAFESEKQKCLRAGMNDFLAKPISMSDFKSVLSTNFPCKQGV